MSDSFNRRVQEKIASLRAEGKEDRARTLEGYLAKINAALGDGELTKLPEAS